MTMKLAPNEFKKAIGERRTQVGIWNSLCSIIGADVLGTAGYDWVLIDMEHSPIDLMTIMGQLQAYEVGGTSAVVRPPWNEPIMVKRLLDTGARSLLFPMVQTAEEALAAVRATRYPPQGIRGVSLMTRAARFGRVSDYLDRANDEITVLVQIESRAALGRVSEIAAVDGVDGVFFGPVDLSADLGLLGKPGHPDVTAAIDAGFEKVKAAGKPAGILVGDAVQATRWIKAGFTFVACGSDAALLARGAENLRKQVADATA